MTSDWSNVDERVAIVCSSDKSTECKDTSVSEKSCASTALVADVFDYSDSACL